MKLAVILLMLSVFKPLLAELAEYYETSIVDRTGGERDDELPVSPEIIEMISSNMTMNECLRTYGFLLGHYKAQEKKTSATLRELKAYANKYAQKRTNSVTFPTCSSLLDRWNRKMAIRYSGMQAKRVLRLSLRSVRRNDLEVSMLDLIAKRQEEELKSIEAEIANHKTKPEYLHNHFPSELQKKESNILEWMTRAFLITMAVLIPISLVVLIKQSSTRKSYFRKETKNKTPESAEEKPLVVST